MAFCSWLLGGEGCLTHGRGLSWCAVTGACSLSDGIELEGHRWDPNVYPAECRDLLLCAGCYLTPK